MMDSHSKLAAKFHLIFDNIEGKEVIEHLESMASASGLSGNSMMDIQAEINPADCMFIREGQNQVIRYINAMIKYHKDFR